MASDVKSSDGDDSEGAWTASNEETIAPLTAETFVQRMNALSRAVNAANRLRRAVEEAEADRS